MIVMVLYLLTKNKNKETFKGQNPIPIFYNAKLQWQKSDICKFLKCM